MNTCAKIRMGRLLVVSVVAGIAAVGTPRARAADRAAINRSVASAVRYLRSIQNDTRDGRDSLCAYALLKAGVKPTDPGNAKMIAEIVERCSGEEFVPNVWREGVYSTGIEAMILSDVDPEKYKPQLKKMAQYLFDQQYEHGGFDYTGPGGPGDTSVTQYATLGLWAVARAGIEVPPAVWDNLARWHLSVQESDGGFAYQPGRRAGIFGENTNGTMTAAAVASMTICAMYLHPERMYQMTGLADGLQQQQDEESNKQVDPNDPLGVLTVRDEKPESSESGEPAGPYQPKATFNAIRNSVSRAVGFVSPRFTTQYYKDSWRHYHYYTLERMGSLADLDKLGEHDWFDECADELIRTQQSDGSWNMPGMELGQNHCVATSLAVLFLTRSTAKLLNRQPPADPIGGGIQIGGRGLPDDLGTVTMQEDGSVKSVESTGPLDDLLKSLETADADELFDIQTEIVKKIQLGDRSELIGQTDRLIELVEHPSPEIRRMALWALARSDDLTLARYAVAALEDPDSDVLMEAHNALCWLSRRPNAFDIPASPLAELPEDATEAQQAATVEKWRADALKKWGQWYLRMCTYEERNTPFAHDLANKIGLR